jgi:hypothetical protein
MVSVLEGGCRETHPAKSTVFASMIQENRAAVWVIVWPAAIAVDPLDGRLATPTVLQRDGAKAA